jgi:hypothetical protein
MMSRSRGSLLTAWFLLSLSASLACLTADSSAQVYEGARRALDLSPDPIARAPRLLGMGQLTLVNTVNNRLNLWDFAGNPTGVVDADTVTSFEMRPATSSAAGVHDENGLERQDEGARESRIGYEAWRRTPGGAAYGFYGDAASLRDDGLFSQSVELRQVFRAPRVVGVLNGHMPRFKSERLRYAFDVFYGLENRNDEYRTLFQNSVGEFLGRKGDLLSPPDFFTPNEYRVSTLGGGTGLSYVWGRTLTTALMGTIRSSRIEGENSSVIHDTGTGENRHYYILQGSATGRGLLLPGTSSMPLEWVWDSQTWTASDEATWVFTLKAGINQEPFAGRGKLYDRREDGYEHRFRARLWSGPFELNGAAGFWRDVEQIRPPDDNDLTSFNKFIDLTSIRDGADTLALPDSVRFNHSTDRGVNAALGATWRLSKALLGAEYHVTERKLDSEVAGAGPDRRVWDVRTGLEYACTPVFAGRLGYIYRFDDRDLNSTRNEFKSNVLTAGFGLARPGSVWSVDLGWSIEWLKSDFEDATNERGSRQTLAAQLRWAL